MPLMEESRAVPRLLVREPLTCRPDPCQTCRAIDKQTRVFVNETKAKSMIRMQLARQSPRLQAEIKSSHP